MLRKIHIVAGGPKRDIPTLEKDPSIFWIGVDEGVKYLLDTGITPDYAIGDFDSVTNEFYQSIKQCIRHETYQAEKDDTDLAIAMRWAVSNKAECITIYGATGGRMDHTYANIALLYECVIKNPNIHFKIIDTYNEISMHLPGTHYVKRNQNYPYLSFFAYQKNISGLSLQGMKYPLDNYILTTDSTLCVSNELIAEIGHVSFDAGILMMIRSKDLSDFN